jgi:hypothetical protein
MVAPGKKPIKSLLGGNNVKGNEKVPLFGTTYSTRIYAVTSFPENFVSLSFFAFLAKN